MCSTFSFFFNDTPTPEIYTLSLHDALPISFTQFSAFARIRAAVVFPTPRAPEKMRSEEHTSELQSHVNLVCRLLLEKKKTARVRGARCEVRGSLRRRPTCERHSWVMGVVWR